MKTTLIKYNSKSYYQMQRRLDLEYEKDINEEKINSIIDKYKALYEKIKIEEKF